VLATISNNPETNNKITSLDDRTRRLVNRNEKPNGINSDGIVATQFADSSEEITGNKRKRIRI
jgi:hypothetical protein